MTKREIKYHLRGKQKRNKGCKYSEYPAHFYPLHKFTVNMPIGRFVMGNEYKSIYSI